LTCAIDLFQADQFDVVAAPEAGGDEAAGDSGSDDYDSGRFPRHIAFTLSLGSPGRVLQERRSANIAIRPPPSRPWRARKQRSRTRSPEARRHMTYPHVGRACKSHSSHPGVLAGNVLRRRIPHEIPAPSIGITEREGRGFPPRGRRCGRATASRQSRFQPP